VTEDPRIAALPDIHGHAKGEHKPFAEERPIPYTARMLFLWFFHACRRGSPRFLMVADHMNYLTFEDPAAVNLVRRALKLAQAGDLYGAAETAGVEIGHAAVVSEGLRKGMRYSIGAEVDNDPRSRPDAQNIVDAMKPDGTVRSVHFIPIVHPQHGENWMWPFDNAEFKDLYDVVGTEAVWEIYMTTLLDAIDKLPGNIVGHFYVPAKFGHWPGDAVLEGYEDRFVEACAERGMAIEVNSRYLYKYFVDDEANLEKYRRVHLRLLRKAKEKGVAIAVGSDAHSPKDQGGAFEAVLALLDEADVNEIAFPIGGRLARVALRATEEILRQHSAALAPPPPPVVATHAEPVEDEAEEEAEDEAERVPVVAAAASKRKRASAVALAEPAAHEPATSAAPAATAKPKKQKTAAASIVDAIVENVASAIPAAVDAVVVAVKEVARKKPASRGVPNSPAAGDRAVPAAASAVDGHATVAPPPAARKSEPKKVETAAAKKPPAKKIAAKPLAKKASAKKTAAPPAKKSAKKPIAKKAVARKAAVKKALPSKALAKKAGAKKAGAKNMVAKKPVAKKVAAKRPASKKVATKKTAVKKSAAKKTQIKRHVPVRRPVAKKTAKKAAKRSRR
jgi:histone H1/5